MLSALFFFALAILVVSIYYFPWYYEYQLISLPPIVRWGLEAECEGTFVKANDRGDACQEWFHRNTLILGWDKKNNQGAGQAKFMLKLPGNIVANKRQTSAHITFIAERYHAGLHAKDARKEGSIYVGGRLVDRLILVSRMEGGEDYGFRNVGPIALDPEADLRPGEEIEVRLEATSGTSWDIDRVELQIVKGENRLSTTGSMFIGAGISAMMGLFPSGVDWVIWLIMT